MPEKIFIQMSGAPGSGKTTVANEIARRIGAVIIDHDVTKSALLNAGIPAPSAGPASYEVLAAFARHLLVQGYSVIFDSPYYYEQLLERGQRLAKEAGAEYRYVECVVEDLDELDRRLRNRTRLPSQLAGVWAPPTDGSEKARSGEEVFRDWIANMKRPVSGYLALDTSRSLEVCVQEAMAYTDPTIHLLPNFDEHLISYKDRCTTLDPAVPEDLYAEHSALMAHLIVKNGLFIGGWRRALGRKLLSIETELLVDLNEIEMAAVEEAARHYGPFLGLPVTLDGAHI